MTSWPYREIFYDTIIKTFGFNFLFSVGGGVSATTLDCAPSSAVAGCTTTGTSSVGQVMMVWKMTQAKSNQFFYDLECLLYYCKLVETFHNVSECKTVVYFDWWLALQIGWMILTVNLLALLHFWTDWELHLTTETEQDRTRLLLLQ